MHTLLKYLGLVAFIVAAVAGYKYLQDHSATPRPSPSGSPVACTMEAKLCPDGTAVGRVGPNCEFAPCPTPHY